MKIDSQSLRKILLSGVCGIIGAGALSSSLNAEPLQDAVVRALNNHPSVEAAIAGRDSFLYERREYWANYFPNLNLRAAGGRMFGDNSTSRGLQVTRDSTYSYLWEGSATLTQPIFRGFETENRMDAAEARADSARYNIQTIREDLALSTVLAYLDVLRARETLSKIEGHGRKIDDYLVRMNKMVDEGAGEESIIVQARDIKSQLDNTRNNIKGQLASARASFAELTGYLPDETLDYPATTYFEALYPDAGQAFEYAKNHHPELKAADETTKAVHHDAEAETQAYFPDIDGELSYLKRDQAEEIGGEVVDAKALIRMNWDISVAGGQVARVKKTRARAIESRAQKHEILRAIERDIKIAYSEIDTAIAQVEILQDRLKINQDLFSTYQAQFEGARINLLQLLQAENGLFNAQLALMNGNFRLMAAQFAALTSTGQLQDALGLGPVVSKQMAAQHDHEKQ